MQRPREDARDRLDFELLVSGLSAELFQVSAGDVDDAIVSGFKRIREFFDFDRCGLLEVDPDLRLARVSHVSYGEGVPRLSGSINLADLYPWTYEHVVVRGEPLRVNRLIELPPEAEVDRRTWESHGIRSSMHIPIRSADGIRHLVSLGILREERHLAEEFVYRIQLVGEVFVNALERKRSEETLRRNEARLALAADSAEAGLWELDLQSMGVWATPKTYELYGIARDALLDLDSVLARIHEDDRERVRLAIDQAIRTGLEFQAECRVILSNGSLRWVASRGRVRHTVGSECGHLLGISLDVTARKEAELALKAAHEEIHKLKDRLLLENVKLRQESRIRSGGYKMVGQSEALRKVIRQIEQVAPTNAIVLIDGETGTGKELVARAVHAASSRREHQMVSVNCGAIPGALIESELFGREKGAYTGALAKQIGRFELAHGSTIFLDEISELSLDLQVKLLRVLQERTFERLGSPKTINVDVRVIAATNHDLESAVREGRFRQDLYYRLSIFPIRVPPLRERRDDIPLLAWAFVEEFNQTMGKAIDSIARESLDAMVAYPWPGNVRELRNAIERAMILATGPCLQVTLPKPENGNTWMASMLLTDVERDHILAVLRMTNGRIRGKNGAAEILGINPSTLTSRMAKLGIRRVPD